MFDFDFAKVFRPLVMEFLVQFPSPVLLLIGLGVYWIGERGWYAKSNISITVVFLINTFGPDINLANIMPDAIWETEAARVGLSVAGPLRRNG